MQFQAKIALKAYDEKGLSESQRVSGSDKLMPIFGGKRTLQGNFLRYLIDGTHVALT